MQPTELEKQKAIQGVKQDLDFDGFKFTGDPELLDDIRFISTIRAIEQDKDLTKIIDLSEVIMGKDQFNAMVKYFEEKEGKFSLTKLGAFYRFLISKMNPKA